MTLKSIVPECPVWYTAAEKYGFGFKRIRKIY